MAEPGPGDRVPDIELTLDDGSTARLSDYAGTWLVLYFYPKDNTSGCTRESQDFRDLHEDFRKAGARVLGASRDSVKSHAGFRAKHELPFPLASDPTEALCRAFDVIREKNMYGRKVLGIQRSTFLIAPDGHIHAAWRGVRVPGHAQTVLDALRQA